MDAFVSQMSLDGRKTKRRAARCSWGLAAAALGLLLAAPGLARASGDDAGGGWTVPAYSPPGLTLRASEEVITTGVAGLWLAPCQFTLPFDSESVYCHGSSGNQSPSASTPSSPPAEDEKEQLKVNPITGLALAPQSNYSPLTGSERWKLYLKMTYGSAGPYLSPVFNALLLDQDNGAPRQWGGGFPGFGRRLASRAGNAVLEGTFQAPLAALLHEDVRYIPTTHRSFQRRALHAILYSFLTYNDKGHPTLNIANLTAYYASTAVTTAWLPGIQSAVRYTFTNASEQIALSFPLNVVQEFWPEIRRHLFRQH